jgi:SAM-dependent methyltransferase
MDAVTQANREAWEAASRKHVREYDVLLAQAASGASLNAVERGLLAGILDGGPEVVHLQSGHGLEDAALVQAGAKSVVGVDYSAVAAGAAQQRADDLRLACRYIVGAVPGVPLADLVYTGKGALIWMPDLDAWAREAARLLRPGGHLLVYEGHPAVPLWTWDEDAPGIRADRSYFARSHVNDTFPARGAVEWQHPRPGRHRRDHRGHGTAVPRRVPAALLETRWRPRRGLERVPAQRLQPARPPPSHPRRPVAARPAGPTARGSSPTVSAARRRPGRKRRGGRGGRRG